MLATWDRYRDMNKIFAPSRLFVRRKCVDDSCNAASGNAQEEVTGLLIRRIVNHKSFIHTYIHTISRLQNISHSFADSMVVRSIEASKYRSSWLCESMI